MNERRDNGSSERGSAAAQSGTPAGGQPRKPRIEVLQRAPAAAAGPRSGQDSEGDAVGRASASASGAPAAQASWTADRAQPAGTAPAPRRGLLRSPTMLLSLLACIVIAGFLLYTYVSSERDAVYSDKGTQLSPEDANLLGTPRTDTDSATTEEPVEPPAAASIDDGMASEPGPAAPSAPQPAPPRPAAPEDRPAAADRPDDPPAAETEPADDESDAAEDAAEDAADAVHAFYSALGAGDGTSAARLVVPAKRRSGPLSAGALTRYYSSFRRPLRLRRVIPVDSNTVRVAYDYVLADGRVCRGQAAVDVVQRDGRSLVSGIRTRGPC